MKVKDLLSRNPMIGLLAWLGLGTLLYPSLALQVCCSDCTCVPISALKLSIASLMGNQKSSLRKLERLRMESVLADIFILFFNDKVCTFDEFYEAFLDFCSKFNSILPGRHFCVPLEDVKVCYGKWNEELDEDAKLALIAELLREHLVIDHTNDTVLMTGLITPPVAVFLKRVVPDFIFVPICTVLAVFAAKMIQNKRQNDLVRYQFHSSSQQQA
ncbi:hypothetical protein J5N97_018660 [Dioscorea zingiberensis]|uniref:Uncharacterized protein n=1 Tax=Dioscorea zingiberensis TaxID=325984 RepID=A0A9D5CCB3_9LILI|nr:hypothetical protein J5N97_018660 [Dioscorea zingiberensis]